MIGDGLLLSARQPERLGGCVVVCPGLLKFSGSFFCRNSSSGGIAGADEDPGCGSCEKADEQKTIHCEANLVVFRCRTLGWG
jgi:hypothetical protein